jgi:hypothetical protein
MERRPANRTVVDAKTSLALWLRAGRAQKGMTLDDVARVTKIQPRILERLEAGKLDGLPAEVFVRGFVRSVARCVGLDEEEALRRYQACAAVTPPASGPAPATPTARALVETMSELAPETAFASGSAGDLPAIEPVIAEAAPVEVAPAATASDTVIVVVKPSTKKKRRGGKRAAKGERRRAIGTPAEASKVVETKDVDANDAKSVDADVDVDAKRDLDTKSADATNVDAKPIAAKHVDTKHVGAKHVGAKHGAKRVGASCESGVDANGVAADDVAASAARDLATSTESSVDAKLACDAKVAHDGDASASDVDASASDGDASACDVDAKLAHDVDAKITGDAGANDDAAEPAQPVVDLWAPPPLDAPLTTVVEAPVTTAVDVAEATPATDVWAPTMPPLSTTPSVPWSPTSMTASRAPVVPSLVIDDADPDIAERLLEDRNTKQAAARRSFLPPILLDREDRSNRQGGLTLAVIILLIAATLTLSYLMRRPSSGGTGVTMIETTVERA